MTRTTDLNYDYIHFLETMNNVSDFEKKSIPLLNNNNNNFSLRNNSLVELSQSLLTQ